MIQDAVKQWELKKENILKYFSEKHPDDYKEIVNVLIKNITSEDDYDDFNPDPERIHEINDGSYQGTLVYVIAEKGYQPNKYFYTKVYYGSCSGCDTLEGIKSEGSDYDEKPNKDQAKQYQTLALHILQSLKIMGDE